MSYISIGFTPEQEKQLLDASIKQGEASETMSAWMDKQDRIRLITTASILIGVVYTLMRIGDLAITWRKKKPTAAARVVEEVGEEA